MKLCDVITILLVAAAIVCVLIAAATSICGFDNLLQNHPWINGLLLVIIFTFLSKRGKKIDNDPIEKIQSFKIHKSHLLKPVVQSPATLEKPGSHYQIDY